ncbi:DotU family type IV/VI secretion system protein [Pandoraea sp. NPDC090278]|uniref:DotU family type IV/VI secretion system protein n=1 Tax=Pandoraea sp. NPDC090278 TaxID=3364391 RepID=UPI00383B09E2
MTSTVIEPAGTESSDVSTASANVTPSRLPAIRPFVRDAALLVATLAAGGKAPDPIGLAQRAAELLDAFDAALLQTGIDEQVRTDASVALCALLDETALRHMDERDRAAWELSPLQVQRFGVHDAGERVFTRLDTYLAMSTTAVEIFEFYSAILGLGFVGRYILLGDAERRKLMTVVDKRIAQHRPHVHPSFVVERTSRRFLDRLFHLSPWMIAGLACLVAVLVWGGWNAALDAQVSHLESTQGRAVPGATGSVGE